MRFDRLDLNLLVALDALLSEKSVSLAADRICLSPSATSSVLGRLREYFKDELLLLKGRNMVLTPRAEGLIEPVRAVLHQIRTTIAMAPEFIPEVSDRTIVFMASDFITEVILSRFVNQIKSMAPHMRFCVEFINDQPISMLEKGDVDILITLDYGLSSEHPCELLFTDHYVTVAWDGNPQVGDRIDAETYFALGHVTTQFGRSRLPAFEDWFIRNNAPPRRVEIIAPSFLSVPFMLIGSDRIATMHASLAQDIARHLPIRIFPVPFDMPEIRVGAQWHISNSNDQAIRWIVGELRRSAVGSGMKVAALHPDDMAQRNRIAERFQGDHLRVQDVRRFSAR